MSEPEKRRHVLVLGISGMLGNAVFRTFAFDNRYQTTGTVRSLVSRGLVTPATADIVRGIDVENVDCLTQLFSTVRPDIVINCVGLVKQIDRGNDVLSAIPINSVLPHRLARLCHLVNARLIHVSTDCVFSGERGGYVESDPPDARDVYGRTKLLGEVDYPNAITVRTSIIGHELNSGRGLVDWFLAQDGEIHGFKKAFFSGLPTVELAVAIRDYVIPNSKLSGVYHVSAERISKYDLLQLVATRYEKKIAINPNESFEIDRSLDSTRFRAATGYKPPSWPELIERMHQYYQSIRELRNV
jgi:dTDP-4-dehydrorhamnose reductase